MLALIQLSLEKVKVDFTKPIDLSLRLGVDKAKAWYLGQPRITPVRQGDWIAKVSQGATINFNTLKFNPHAHGTHTECYGHISKEFYGVSDCLSHYFFKAKLVSLTPASQGKDRIFTEAHIREVLTKGEAEALIIRSMPNEKTKKNKNYDHSNWPYLTAEAAAYIRECGIDHLLIDLPSVDREEGEVNAHKAFWNYPEEPRKNASITELIYVPEAIEDGMYVLNLQVANFENDAAPSRPVLYAIGELNEEEEKALNLISSL